jgi:two-component system, cell cycle sensor histidine kinase and response regulator CckA
MGKTGSREKSLDVWHLRFIAKVAFCWVVFLALIPDFLMQILNIDIPRIHALTWGISFILICGFIGYLSMRVFRERQFSLLIIMGIVLIVMSQSFRIALSLGIREIPFIWNWRNELGAMDNFINGLGIVLIVLAFIYTIIEMLTSRQQLLEEHAKLSVEVSRRKEAEKEYRTILQTAMDGFWIVNREGLILDVNDAYCRIIGYSREELLNMRIQDVEAAETSKEVVTHIQETRKKGTDRFETHHRRKDGIIVDIEVSASGDPQENDERQWVFLRDITERNRAEEERRSLEAQLQHGQKLEELGVLAGGIAHDFNNILQIILGNVDLIQKIILKMSPARPFVDNIKRSVDRAALLTNQMLAYAGKKSISLQVLDLGAISGDIIHLIQSSVSKKVTLHMCLTQGLPLVEADAAQIQQVLMNLVLNASEALNEESGGVVTVSTMVLHCTEDYLSRNLAPNNNCEGDYVCLEVSDTGCGMNDETKKKLFDPFFTTKFTGRGLGMSAVLGIIRAHKGAILVESIPGKGTIIRVLFPALPRSQSTASEEGQEKSVATPGVANTILFVDDEPDMRDLGLLALGQMGYMVLTAADGLDAIEIFKAHFEEIACVLLDLSMPRMDGGQALLELRRIKPDVCVILASGYAEEELEARFTGQDVNAFLQKPYDIHALSETLKKVLG